MNKRSNDLKYSKESAKIKFQLIMCVLIKFQQQILEC